MEQSFNRAFTLYKVKKFCPNLVTDSIPSSIHDFFTEDMILIHRSMVDCAGVCEEFCPASSQHAGGHVQVWTGGD